MKRTLAILIIIGTILWSFNDMLPSFSSSATTESTEFSVQNALYHLKNISKKPHYTGSEEHKVVQNYLVNELKKLGLQPEIQTETVFNSKWVAGTTIENVVAKIEGTSNGKSLLLLTHYDSSPSSSLGGSDAGSGVVTILEGVRAFLAKNEKPKNDIIVVFSDAEELGLLGAQAFVNSHPLAKNIGLVLNFEARGSGGASYMLLETNGKNSKLINEFLKAKPNYPVANSLLYSIYKMLPNDTDLTVFREDGDINGFNFAFIDDHFDYHTAQDSYERLDRETLAHQGDYITTGLNYFSNADLSNMNSEEDLIYVNFPFIKMLTYPFAWILPMLIIASVIFLVLIFFGFRHKKITTKGLFKGFVPFLLSLVLTTAISFGLWQLILLIHPQYEDMLHGFTYNGYQYIAAFVFLNLWIVSKIYNYFKDEKTTNLLIAPITIWLLVNLLIYQKLQGAGFFIIPVFIALLVLAILLFTNLKKKNLPVLIAILSIPTVYMFAPLVKMFPVGLGLKNLFISALFISLLFGLLIPIFHQQKQKNRWQFLFGLFTIILFGIATFKSGFSIDEKRPNSLVYIQNEDDKSAYFGTYNKTLDTFINQKLGDNPTQGSIQNSDMSSKYGTRFNFHTKTDNKEIPSSNIQVVKDTIIGGERHVNFNILPKRKISKIEMLTSTEGSVDSLYINRFLVNKGENFKFKRRLFSYFMANTDSLVNVKFQTKDTLKLDLILNEISYDLLNNPKFKVQPRTEEMMPMPFVVNDAIITSKKINFNK